MSASDPGAGIEIPGLRLGEIIGRGGMGVVYRAYQERLDRWIAVKVISPHIADDPSFRARFEHESRLAAAIEHPSVLPVYDSGEAGGRLYIAMRLIEGSDLRTAIARDGALPPARAVSIVAQVADALDTAHAAGLVHRDIKPANILLARPGQAGEHAYLSDFGLSKRMASLGGPTKTGEIIGTVDYMAPEQWRGDRVDGRTDVYALGAVLFEALTGRVPFARDSEVAKLYAHLNDPPPAPSTVAGGVPPALDVVVARALAKDPAERFASAGDFGRAARAALEGRPLPSDEHTVARGAAAPVPPPRPGGGDTPTTVERPPPPPPPEPPRRRLGVVIGVLAALLVLAGGAVAALALSGDDGGGDSTGTAAGPRGPETVTVTDGTSTPPPEDTTTDPGVDRLAADRTDIADLLDAYERHYTNDDVAGLGELMTDDVRREGRGTPDCTQEGRDEVLAAYEDQVAQSGSYSLDYEKEAIEVSGDTARANVVSSVDGGEPFDLDFEFARTEAGWKIAVIDAFDDLSTC